MNSFCAGSLNENAEPSTPGAPLVSVIVPCYNGAAYLDVALESVAKQTFAHWECIILDDGSTDDSARIAQNWVRRDNRFKYLYQANQGGCGARNKGFDFSSGEFIQFLDADDLLAPRKLEIQLAIFENNPDAGFVYGDFVFTAEQNDFCWQWPIVRSWMHADTYGDMLTNWEKGLSMGSHVHLIRRSYLEKHGHWPPELVTHVDWGFMLNLALNGVKFHHHPDVVGCYRKYLGSVTSNATNMRVGFMQVMLRQINSPQARPRYKVLAAWRYIEEIFKAVLLRLQGRKIDFRKIFFGAELRSPYRELLNLAFVAMLPVLAILKLCDMARFRLINARGENRRMEYSSFDNAIENWSAANYCGTKTRPSPKIPKT